MTDLNTMLANAGYDTVKDFAKQVRNETLDEVVTELQRFTFAFGVDTVDSFAIFIKGLKE